MSTKTFRVIKAEPHDHPSLPSNALSDGTLDQPAGSAAVNTTATSTKRGKPVWRLNTPGTDEKSPATQHHQTTNIKPAEMMHVALNYGGLPGFAYVHSLHDFGAGIEDEMVKEVVARRCDLLTDRAYSIGMMFREAVAGKCDKLVDSVVLEECFREYLADRDAVLDNNELIIRTLSACDLEETTRESLVRKLQSQLSSLTASTTASGKPDQ